MKLIQLALALPTYFLGVVSVANAGRLGYSHHLINADAKFTGHHTTTSSIFGRKLSEDDADGDEKGGDDKDEEEEEPGEDETDADAAKETMSTASMSIFDLVAANEKDLSILGTAVVAAGLQNVLAGPGPFTVFAPRDKAFEDIDVNALVSNKDALEKILRYHVVPGYVYSKDLPAPGNEITVETADAAKDKIVIEVKDNGKVKINEAKVKKVDIKAINGVVHIIDEVLIPPMTSDAEAASSTEEMKESAEKETEDGDDEDEKEGDEEEDAKGDEKEEEEDEKSKD